MPLPCRGLACTGLSPSSAPLSNGLQFVSVRISRSYNPGHAETCPVWAPPGSLAATAGITLVFSSSGYLDVSVRRVRPPCGVPCLQHGGLPHSDTRGSKLVCSSPRIFAAYRVLRRLWEPRHPPCALCQLVAVPFFLYISLSLGDGRQKKRPPPRVSSQGAPVRAPCPNMSMIFAPPCPSGISPKGRKHPFQLSPFGGAGGGLWRMSPRSLGGTDGLDRPIPTSRWRMSESNRRPPACKAGALAS